MLSSMETPRRPLPPAKARKANAAMQALLKTPPPAYGSPFTFPERSQEPANILGSPLVSTYQVVGWAEEDEGIEGEELSIADEVVNEKSREELKELLVKAGQIIRQRENELGVTSAVCKGLHSNNIALKSKHEALLARLPNNSSPPRSISSPANLYRHATSRGGSVSIPASSSDSAVDYPESPEIPYHHARKVSIANADISLLADQNAELLDKLEKLEMEATHSDQVGRRELKRLEKEIEFLREALEKTQERSEELENKVQTSMATEAWRRKKEREAKFRAMRNLGKDDASPSTEVRDFAPQGSNFGGPSQGYRLRSDAPNSYPHHGADGESASGSQLPGLSSPEHSIIAQLLTKVKELEETNTRILQQQSETADQLSAVQRDTAHITKVYDYLADPHYSQLQLDNRPHQEDEYDQGEPHDHATTPVGQTIRFVSLRRNIEDDMDGIGTRIVHPKRDAMFSSTTKHRKSVMGLFDEHGRESAYRRDEQPETEAAFDARLRDHLALSPWNGEDNFSSWSSNPDSKDMPQRPSLSPLHFFSPPPNHQAEISPVGTRATLQHELMREFGQGASWEAASGVGLGSANRELHLRTSSLYDLSEYSVPPSPSPPERAMSRRGSEELDFEAIRWVNKDALSSDGSRVQAPSSGLLMPKNSLQLSIEPPTPEKRRVVDYSGPGFDDLERNRPAAMSSPRVQKMTQVLRAREDRWSLDRRLRPRTSFLNDSVDARKAASAAVKETQQLASLCELNFNSDSADYKSFGGNATGGGGVSVNASGSRSDPSTDATAVNQPSVPRRLMNAVDSMIDGFAESATDIRDAIVLNYDDVPDEKSQGDNGDVDADSDDDSAREVYHSAPVTPELRARPLRNRRSGLGNGSQAHLQAEEDDMHLHPRSAAASPSQTAAGTVHSEGGLMLRVWLWIQFAIVVFVFLYAMARRGPSVVLTDGDSKRNSAVARRRNA